ncbi:hypothetical protein OROGR_006355 [Orobanche gracilis]
MYAAKTLNPSVSVDRTSLHRTSLQCNAKSDADTWTGLPLGVKFDPSDQEINSYLLAKVNSENHTSDFVDRYITTIDDEDGICFAHPGDLSGMKDRHVSFFFHKLSKAHRSGERKRRKIKSNNGEIGRWKQTGRARSVLLDGVTEGYKKILVLQKSNNEKTEWVMHQYHLGTKRREKEGEYVVSKVFKRSSYQIDTSANDELLGNFHCPSFMEENHIQEVAYDNTDVYEFYMDEFDGNNMQEALFEQTTNTLVGVANNSAECISHRLCEGIYPSPESLQNKHASHSHIYKEPLSLRLFERVYLSPECMQNKHSPNSHIYKEPSSLRLFEGLSFFNKPTRK